MSTASDISAYEHSVEPAHNDMLFNSKKWTYIQDSTSNTGQYAGQIQFNLSTISSQAAFVNWQEAVIQLPIKLQILNGSSVPITSTVAATVDQLIPKAGSWQFIDSVQVVVDGVTVQTNQIHENVNATLKALTECAPAPAAAACPPAPAQQDVSRHGASTGFSLDDYKNPVTNSPQTLDNVTATDFIGTTVGEFGMSNTFFNSGALERSKTLGLDQSSTKLASTILGGQDKIQTIGKPQVYVALAGAVAAGSPYYVAHYIAQIRLADICDYFKKCPMQKNVQGFIYLNYNSSISSIVKNGNAALGASNISSFGTNMQYGNTCPVMYNLSSATATATYGTATGLTVPASTLTITADVNGTSTSGSGITPSVSFSRLLVPTYTPNPMADGAITQKKTFRYFERITNKFNARPGESFTWTIFNGIANPKKLWLCPVITNPTAAATTPDTFQTLRSCLTTVPATTSPFVAIRNLQVTVGNLPMYNNPVNFGYDQFMQEMRDSGTDGGLDDETNKGLLNQQQWESLYRFIPVDIGRRLPSEDGASKSIVVSGVNNTNYSLTIYYHVLRDAIATVDSAMGSVSQTPVQK